MKRPALTMAGADIALVARLPDGRAVTVTLDRHGTPTRYRRVAHAHELRGIGWHLGEIKRAIGDLPVIASIDAALPPSPTPSPERPATAPRPSAWLHAHHAAAED